MRFFTSDHHFDHKNIMLYCPLRQQWDSVEKMNQGLIDNWNKTVGVDDEVYYLGDFTLRRNIAQNKDLFNSLNGKKYMVKGNHDLSRHKLEKVGWINIPTGTVLELVHSDPTWEVNGINSGKAVICHNPGFAMKDYYPEGFDFVLHGHVHEAWRLTYIHTCVYYNVGVDVNDYTPISADEVLDLCLRKTILQNATKE